MLQINKYTYEYICVQKHTILPWHTMLPLFHPGRGLCVCVYVYIYISENTHIYKYMLRIYKYTLEYICVQKYTL